MGVSRNPARPVSGSPAYSPDDLPVYRGGSGGDTPAPACTITLTGDIAAVFGGQPLDISGQTVSKTVPASPANFYAAGSSPNVAVDWEGWRVFEYVAPTFTTVSTSIHQGFAANSTYSTLAQAIYSSGQWTVAISSSPVATFGGASDDIVGIRINGQTGDVEFYIGDNVVTKADAAGLGGLFSGQSIAEGAGFGDPFSATLTEGDTYSANIITAGENIRSGVYPAGTLDWCGQDTVVTA